MEDFVMMLKPALAATWMQEPSIMAQTEISMAVFYFASAITMGCLILLIASLLFSRKTGHGLERLMDVTRMAMPAVEENRHTQQVRRFFRLLAAWLGAHLGLRADFGLERRFLQAGLPGPMAADLYQSARILGPIIFLVLGSMLPVARVFWMAALPALAYLLPDLVLSHLVRRRRDRIRRSVPDVVDLLVICVDAGLGLDQAMLRVGEELSVSHPDTHAEILHINREQRAGRPRTEAWAAMAERVQVPDIDALVNMLMQTERFGTPIAKALSTFADAVRLKRRQAAEELAAKSTIKIIFPLVFFIFPAIFIVLLGPAALNIMHAMQSQK
jgi:tight adherence protein C